MSYLDNDVLDELLEILGAEDLHAITESFVTQLHHQLADLNAQSDHDFAEIARIAHSLKGGAGNLGANVLSEVAAALERHARDDQADQVAVDLARLTEIANHTIAEFSARRFI